MSRGLVCAWIALSLGLVASDARAHPLEFCALHVAQTREGYDVRLEYSGTESAPAGARLEVPAGCSLAAPITTHTRAAGETLHARLRCATERAATLRVVGLADSVSVLLTLESLDGTLRRERARGPSASFELTGQAPQSAVATLVDYGRLGVEHIAMGFDHLLFVLLLLFFHRRGSERASAYAGRLALTISAFTVGHSITLGLATLGALSLPAAPVEASIALSIVLLAAELARAERSGARDGLSFSRPWLIAGVFGLLHGLGFAGALADVGLPPDAAGAALVGFNVGVELGQLAFVALALAALAALRPAARLHARAPLAAAYLAGILAFAWTLERAAQL